VGFTAVTFLVVLPFVQVMVVFFTAAAGDAVALGVGVATGFAASWVNFTFKVGAEKVKLFADKYIQPFRSPKRVVAIWLVPSAETIEMVAETGAFVNP
jgi:hypothetical protein